MLKIKNPLLNGYVGAILDENGDPVKVVCDVLEVSHYVLDADTSPMMTLTATYARFDSSKNYLRAGPLTQHMITGEELALILEGPGGVSVEAIDASTAKTGIPSAGIGPEDISLDPILPAWRTEYYVQKLRDAVKKIEEEMMMPANIPDPPIQQEPTP